MENYKIFQLYYDGQTKGNCISFPGFEPVENGGLDIFFENHFIEGLGQHAWYSCFKNKYIGAISHNFFIKNSILPETIKSEINKSQVDVYSFSRGQKVRNVIDTAENYHPGFKRAMQILLDAIGYEVDINEPTRMVCYQNAFIAKSEIYKDYVDRLLSPALSSMSVKGWNEEFDKIVYSDSGYYRKKQAEIKERLIKYTGLPYYPYHPFICERLFSLYMQKNKHITFKHLC